MRLGRHGVWVQDDEFGDDASPGAGEAVDQSGRSFGTRILQEELPCSPCLNAQDYERGGCTQQDCGTTTYLTRCSVAVWTEVSLDAALAADLAAEAQFEQVMNIRILSERRAASTPDDHPADAAHPAPWDLVDLDIGNLFSHES